MKLYVGVIESRDMQFFIFLLFYWDININCLYKKYIIVLNKMVLNLEGKK